MISFGIESVRDDCMIEHLHMQFQMQNGYWQLAETTQPLSEKLQVERL